MFEPENENSQTKNTENEITSNENTTNITTPPTKTGVPKKRPIKFDLDDAEKI